MVKNPLIIPKNNSNAKFIDLPKSAGILDDYAVRKNVATKEGTIEHVPTEDNHIANKKYVDDHVESYVTTYVPDFVADYATDTIYPYIDEAVSEIGVSTLAGFDTDDLSEGSTNLYSQWLNNGSEIYFNNNVGIGTSLTNPAYPLHVEASGGIYVKGTSSGDTEIQLSSGVVGSRDGGAIISNFTSYSNSSANPSIFNFQACRGSQSSPSASSNGDRVGRLSYAGRHSGGSFISTALIEARVDAAVSSTEVPLSINFITGTTAGNRTERLRITSAGYCGFATTSPTQIIDINDNSIRLRTAKTPSSASDTGTTGQICWDSNYIYVCVATNTWKRSALGSW